MRSLLHAVIGLDLFYIHSLYLTEVLRHVSEGRKSPRMRKLLICFPPNQNSEFKSEMSATLVTNTEEANTLNSSVIPFLSGLPFVIDLAAIYSTAIWGQMYPWSESTAVRGLAPGMNLAPCMY